MAVDCGDWDGISQAQIIELVDVRIGVSHLVHLVHCQHHGFARLEEHLGHLMIGSSQAGLDIAHKDNDIGVLNGDLRLGPHEGQDLTIGTRLNAAGIHDIEGAVAPLTLGVQPVPGDTGSILYNGQPLAAELIEQHGFAHVGPAHDRN